MSAQTNTLPARGLKLTERETELFGPEAPHIVRPFIELWGPVQPTPLVSLPEIATRTGVAQVVMKEEGQRLGLGSFKALGGAYAVMVLVKERLERHLGEEVAVAQLLSPTARDFASTLTVCCATDGNHGKSVAAGARLLGCRSVIFIHAGVSQARAEAIGADEIIRVEGPYDFSVEEAKRIAVERDWTLVADTAWEGYETIPERVAQGYSILVDEALSQTEQPPTHVFLQAGVGGFASGVAGHLIARLPDAPPVIAIVEPDRAACLYESVRAGELISIPAEDATIMAMLECHTPSLTAWRLLSKVADVFMTVTEDDAMEAMRILANRPDDPIVAGESGAAGLGGLIKSAADPTLRDLLMLTPDSRVLLINTETATDPASYARIVGRTPAEVKIKI